MGAVTEGHPPQAKSYPAAKARRHFISVTVEKQFIQPYSFADHPLEQIERRFVDRGVARRMVARGCVSGGRGGAGATVGQLTSEFEHP